MYSILKNVYYNFIKNMYNIISIEINYMSDSYINMLK